MIWQCTEGILQLQGSLTQVLYSLDSKAMLADEILEELHRTDATTRALHNLQDTLRASGVHVLHAHVVEGMPVEDAETVAEADLWEILTEMLEISADTAQVCHRLHEHCLRVGWESGAGGIVSGSAAMRMWLTSAGPSPPLTQPPYHMADFRKITVAWSWWVNAAQQGGLRRVLGSRIVTSFASRLGRKLLSAGLRSWKDYAAMKRQRNAKLAIKAFRGWWERLSHGRIVLDIAILVKFLERWRNRIVTVREGRRLLSARSVKGRRNGLLQELRDIKRELADNQAAALALGAGRVQERIQQSRHQSEADALTQRVFLTHLTRELGFAQV